MMKIFNKLRILNLFHEYLKQLLKDNFLIKISIIGLFEAYIHGYLLYYFGNIQMTHPTTSATIFYTYYCGGILGTLSSYVFSDSIGRKTTIYYISILLLVALSFYMSIPLCQQSIIIRFILGVLLGIIIPTSMIYVTEISTDESRGRLISLSPLLLVCGLLSCFCMEYIYDYFAWKEKQFILTVPIIGLCVQFLLLNYLPESSRWLLAHKTPTECLESIRTLRNTHDVSIEFNDIYKALSSDARLGDGWIDILSFRSIRQRLCISLFLQQSSACVGILFLSVYKMMLFATMGIHDVTIAIVLLYVSIIIGTVISAWKIDIWGRRYMLITGHVILAILWIAFSFIIHVIHDSLTYPPDSLFFITHIQVYYQLLLSLFIVCMVSIVFIYSMMIASTITTITSELFPLRARGKAISITLAFHIFCGISSTNIIAYYLSSENHPAMPVIPTMSPINTSNNTTNNNENVTDITSINGTITTLNASLITFSTNILTSTTLSPDYNNINNMLMTTTTISNPSQQSKLSRQYHSIFLTYEDNRLEILFTTFAILSILFAVIVYIALPETAGLMLEDMEEIYEIPNSKNTHTNHGHGTNTNSGITSGVNSVSGNMSASNQFLVTSNNARHTWDALCCFCTCCCVRPCTCSCSIVEFTGFSQCTIHTRTHEKAHTSKRSGKGSNRQISDHFIASYQQNSVEDRIQGNTEIQMEEEEEDGDVETPLIYNPNTLHKYSGDMRGSKFLLYRDCEEDSLLSFPASSHSSNTLSNPAQYTAQMYSTNSIMNNRNHKHSSVSLIPDIY